jgi:hypothetical protein
VREGGREGGRKERKKEGRKAKLKPSDSTADEGWGIDLWSHFEK